MPHNAVHKQTLKLDALRREQEGEPVLTKGDAIINAAMAVVEPDEFGSEVDQGAIALALLPQFHTFNNARDSDRTEGAKIGKTMGEQILKLGRA